VILRRESSGSGAAFANKLRRAKGCEAETGKSKEERGDRKEDQKIREGREVK
jgi:hypothetical protein